MEMHVGREFEVLRVLREILVTWFKRCWNSLFPSLKQRKGKRLEG